MKHKQNRKTTSENDGTIIDNKVVLISIPFGKKITCQ